MSNALNKYVLKNNYLNQHVRPNIFVKPRLFLKDIRKVQLKPATLAVLVQCTALITVFVFSRIFHLTVAVFFGTDLTLPLLALVLIQSFLAAMLSYSAGMASWWRWIHLGFPIAIFGMSNWHIPNEIYLAGFVVSLSLFWTTFRSQVPFFPSRPAVWRQVARVMTKNKPVRLIDIGSGLGDMSMYIAKARPDSHVEGIEIAPLPWLVSFVRGKIRRSAAIFKLGDYRSLYFANYDVIFAYLSPAAMLALWEKAKQEMLSGSLLISLEFDIPGVPPSMLIAGNENSPTLYIWQIP